MNIQYNFNHAFLALLIFLFFISISHAAPEEFKTPISVKGHWQSTEEFIKIFESAKNGELSAIKAILDEANAQKSSLLYVLAAEMYENKNNPLMDLSASKNWYWKAAQAVDLDITNIALSQENLAYRFRDAVNDEQSEAKALALFLAASLNGSDTAAYSAGQILLTSKTDYFPKQRYLGIIFVRYASNGAGAKKIADDYLKTLGNDFGAGKWSNVLTATEADYKLWTRKGVFGLNFDEVRAKPIPVKEGRELPLLKELVKIAATDFSDKETSAKPEISPKASQNSTQKPREASPFVATPMEDSTSAPFVKIINSSAYNLTLPDYVSTSARLTN